MSAYIRSSFERLSFRKIAGKNRRTLSVIFGYHDRAKARSKPTQELCENDAVGWAEGDWGTFALPAGGPQGK
jgi:elongation factor P hydroxylase